jgi:hypothetical protein
MKNIREFKRKKRKQLKIVREMFREFSKDISQESSLSILSRFKRVEQDLTEIHDFCKGWWKKA